MSYNSSFILSMSSLTLLYKKGSERFSLNCIQAFLELQDTKGVIDGESNDCCVKGQCKGTIYCSLWRTITLNTLCRIKKTPTPAEHVSENCMFSALNTHKLSLFSSEREGSQLSPTAASYASLFLKCTLHNWVKLHTIKGMIFPRARNPSVTRTIWLLAEIA